MRRPVLRAGWLHDEWCFGCGQANDDGLRLSPVVHDDGVVTADVALAGRGGADGGHLGLLAVPLDCVASWVAMQTVRARARRRGGDPDEVVALTGSYRVLVEGAADVGERIVVRAERRSGSARGEVDRGGRRIEVGATASRPTGGVVAGFRGVFVEASLAATVVERGPSVGGSSASGRADGRTDGPTARSSSGAAAYRGTTDPGTADVTERDVLQHRDWWPDNACFGCGPSNPHGIRLQSTVDDDGVTHATWTAQPHHQGPPGIVNGGVVAVPMDCHGSWTATAAFRRRAEQRGEDPSGLGALTGSYAVRLSAPTPVGVPLTLRGVVEQIDGRRATVTVTTAHDGLVTATFEGVFFLAEYPAPDRPSAADAERPPAT